MRVAIHTDTSVAVAFNGPVAEFVGAAALERHEVLRRLGPDVLGDDFDVAEATARLRARGAMAVGDALLDQGALAGIGNVYKSEACFMCGVHPFAPVSALSDAELERLVVTARRLMQAIGVRTSATDRFPVEQAQLRRWSQGRWRSFGGLWAHRG